MGPIADYINIYYGTVVMTCAALLFALDLVYRAQTESKRGYIYIATACHGVCFVIGTVTLYYEAFGAPYMYIAHSALTLYLTFRIGPRATVRTLYHMLVIHCLIRVLLMSGGDNTIGIFFIWLCVFDFGACIGHPLLFVAPIEIGLFGITVVWTNMYVAAPWLKLACGTVWCHRIVSVSRYIGR